MMGWVAVLSALVGAVAQPASPACPCPPVRQFPAGVVDERSRTVFVSAPGFAVQAVTLDTGRSLWVSSAATLPVGVVGDAVVALRRATDPREVQVVLLDRGSGSVRLTSEPFRPALDPRSDRAFGSVLFSAADDTGSVVVTWKEIAPPPSGVGREGGAPLQSGRVRVQRDGRVDLTHAELPADRSVGTGASYRRGRAYTADAWGGGCLRALATEPKGPLTSVSLLCQPGAAAGPRHELATAATVAATVSLDGCSVFLETPGDSGSSWTAYAAADGSRLGSVRHEPGAWNAATVSGTLYYLTDGAGGTGPARTMLHAVDLQSGVKRWETPVRGPSARRP